MGFVGILGAEDCKKGEKKSIFQDFNLDVCISGINSLAKGYDLLPMYMNMPGEPETIRYRRMVTKDLQDEGLRSAFARYAVLIEKAKKQEKQSVYNNHRPQEEKWHVDALHTYAGAVEDLCDALRERSGLSGELQSLLAYLENYLSTREYSDWRAMVNEVYKKFDEEFIHFSIQKNKVILEEQEDDHEEFGKRMIRAFHVKIKDDHGRAEVHTLSRMERALAERVVRQSGLSKQMDLLMKISLDETLIQLATDVQYYLAFFKFVDEMREKGYPFCLPQEGQKMSIRGGFDTALAVKSEKPVISNDFHMDEKERFFVITGANGGGKTTFARMIGQILYFYRMGLLVPCEEAVIPHFTDVMSHFSNEETEASGRGKLVEELVRLQPMMKAQNENCFVILNELFTTAATMDAGIMGQKVLTHFMEMNCRGIYVTHIQSLAEERDGIVSMVAELEEDHHTRSFKIARKPAREGEYEDSLITKYHMTYDQMKAVMNHED